MMHSYLAQVNIARMLAPINNPVMADFVANLDPINQLAEQSEGFIWRLKDDTNNATSINVFELSVITASTLPSIQLKPYASR